MVLSNLHCPLLLICLIAGSTEPENFNVTSLLPFTLNGHYVTWPSCKMEEKYIEEGRFEPKNIIYTRFQLCSDRVFVAAPRFKRGVPFTLGYTLLNSKDRCFNYITPFPSMKHQDPASSCWGESLVNVIDLVIGPDGMLWVLDSGISETLSDHPTREGDPKIVGFDGATGKVKHSIILRSLSCRKSRLQHLVVEYINETNTMLYASDGGTRAIIVWNLRINEGFRTKLPHKTVEGCADDPENDAFYMALVELQTGNYIYFSYKSNPELYRIKSSALKRRTNPKCMVNVGKKPCKMVILGVRYGSIMFFRTRGKNHLYSWDTKLSFLEDNFMLVRRSKDCRKITHVDVDNGGVLWVLESNIQDYIANQLGCYGPSILLSPVINPPTPVSSEENQGDG